MSCLKHGGHSNVDHNTQEKVECFDCWLQERKEVVKTRREIRAKVGDDLNEILQLDLSLKQLKLLQKHLKVD